MCVCVRTTLFLIQVGTKSHQHVHDAKQRRTKMYWLPDWLWFHLQIELSVLMPRHFLETTSKLHQSRSWIKEIMIRQSLKYHNCPIPYRGNRLKPCFFFFILKRQLDWNAVKLWLLSSLPGGYEWELTAFVVGVFLQLLGLPFVAVSQVSLFSKVTAEKTQGWFIKQVIAA